eukprot:1052514-Pelagomonas_calceolata.AAC.1
MQGTLPAFHQRSARHASCISSEDCKAHFLHIISGMQGTLPAFHQRNARHTSCILSEECKRNARHIPCILSEECKARFLHIISETALGLYKERKRKEKSTQATGRVH